MIILDHVNKQFDTPNQRIHALRDVSLHVQPGEIYGVVGTSGAGKSTLVRTVNNLETPDSGTVTVDGMPMSTLTGRALGKARYNIGMIFQTFNLLASKTVITNVELALRIAGQHGDTRKAAMDILDMVGLADRANQYPATLSGGQKQRVGIARAIANHPKVLLSDEATSALDPETTESILQLLSQLNRDLGLTILLITHEMDVVTSICHSAALMRQGEIIEAGPLQDVLVTPDSALANELFNLGPMPTNHPDPILEVTFSGERTDKPFIAMLIKQFGVDVSLLAASIRNVGASQFGRTRLTFPGTPDQLTQAIQALQDLGVLVTLTPPAGAHHA